MGQTVGRAVFAPETSIFLNLPKPCIYELWEAFNDVAEGFGLSVHEFQEIIRVAIKDYSGLTEERLDDLSSKLFKMFDTDQNDLVDSLEFLSSFAILSGMEVEEKIRFIFGVYDFDESGFLTIDETILAMRATIGGLCKLANINCPLEAEIENIATSAFPERQSDMADGESFIDRDLFISYCKKTAEVASWMEYFGDMEDVNGTTMALPKGDSKLIVIRETKVEPRSEFDLAANDPDDGALTQLEIEGRGQKLNVAPSEQWRSATAFTEPTGVEIDPSAPHVTSALDRVYGHNASYRQNIYYGPGRSIIYPAGSVVVLLDIQSQSQRHYASHTDKVTCLRVFTRKSGTMMVASGQLGHRAKIHVWNTTTLETTAVLRGFHSQGVIQLDVSPSGQLLASVGGDPNHTIGVWDWQQQTLVYTAVSSMLSVHDLHWISNDTFATCGLNHIHFWTIDKKMLRRTRGIFGRKVPKQALLCVMSLNGVVVAGTIAGNLLVWDGRNCVKQIKAHTAAITCLNVATAENGGFITGTDDGKISLWNHNLELGHTFEIKGLGAVEQWVQSICWDPGNQMILLGTLSGEIFEMSDFDGSNIHKGPLSLGHSGSGLWGVSVHPKNPELLATVGSDRTVRLWNLATHKLIKMVVLDTPARCCTFSPEGNVLAVGLGLDANDGGLRKDGAFVALDAMTLTIIHEARDSKRCISDIKFSPNGTVLALGSHDGLIYFYNVADFGCKAKCRGHRGRVTHLDFSVDGLFLQSTCDAGHILFWDVDLCEERAPRAMKNIKWQTQTCVYSWMLKSAWGCHDDKTQLTSCCRNVAGSMIATSDDFGRVRLWRNPVTAADPAYVELRGSAPRLSKVEFTADDHTLVVVGQGDNCLFQWKVDEEKKEKEAEGVETTEKAADELEAGDYRDAQKLDVDPLQEMVNEGDMTKVFAMEEVGAEDDFAPMQPWQRVIVAPSKTPPEDNSEPNSDVILDFVHGYRCHDCRGTVQYIKATRDVVFFTGTIAVVMTPKYHDVRQRFYMEHNDEILSLAVHPHKSVVATGQRGRVPRVLVWDTTTLKTLAILKGFHRRAVTSLRFSHRGKYLVTVGHDQYHCIAVYDWESHSLVAHARSLDKKTLAVDFNLEDNGLIQCGLHFVRFWSFHGRNMTFRNAVIDPAEKKNHNMKQSFLCIGWCGTRSVIGTSSGYLWRFNGCQVEGQIKAHSGPVYTIHSTNEGLITGGKDGYVRLWNLNMQIKIAVDMKMRGSLNPVVRSVCWDNEQFRFLVGTLGNEIYELHTNDGSNLHGNEPLLQGHFSTELWGLCPHPSEPEYATVGDDRTLRIWSIRDHRIKKMQQLENPSRAVAYSPDGDLIAVGFGSPVEVAQPGKRLFDGKWIVMEERTFSIIHEARDSTKWITEIKWSPNGTLLAVGSFDNKIYVYSADSHFALSTVISQHNAWIRHMDFSANSVYLQSNCGAYELCFYEADTGLLIPAASRLKDVPWNTQNCTLGWSVQGIWPAQADGCDVNSVDINFTAAYGDKVVAAGDNYGRLRLFKYPVQSSYAISRTHHVVAGPISQVRWVGGDSHLVTLGCKDKTVFQWRHDVDDLAIADKGSGAKGGMAAVMKIEGEDEDATVFDSDILMKQLVALESSLRSQDEALVTKSRPWVGAVVEPSNAPTPDPKLPQVDVDLAWVHGYNAQLSRNSLAYNLDKDIVYPAANVVVIYDKRSHSQKHFRAHDREILATAIAPNRRVIASADRCRRPQIRVWDAQTCTELSCLPQFHRLGVGSLCFSPDSRRLVSVGQDMDHSLALWASASGTWTDVVLVAHAKGDVNPVYFADFSPPNDEEHTFVTGGVQHIKFWSVNGRNLRCRPGICTNVGVMQTMLCGTWLNQRFVSGGISGHAYVWNGRKLDKVIRAHDTSVTAMHSCPLGLVTGSKDGYVKLWGPYMEHLRSYDLGEAPVLPLRKQIRAVHLGMDAGHTHVTSILVGTDSSEIYEIARDTGSTLLLAEGHYNDELWGLATCPSNKDVYATCGDDSTIRLWSVSLNRVLRKAILDSPARCLAWSPDGKLLVVGLGGSSIGVRQKKDGAFIVLNASNLQVLFEGRDSRHWIREVKFSPDGECFALGSSDNKVYVYSSSTYALRCKCEKHNAVILNLDFSSDSTIIQSDSADYEHHYFGAVDGAYLRLPSQIKDVNWSTWTCTYGWPVQGIWPPVDSPEAEPCSCDRSHSTGLLAVSNETGHVKVYNYPCTSKQAEYVKVKGHPYAASKIRFTSSDEHMVTVGRKDRSVFVWKVKSNSLPAAD